MCLSLYQDDGDQEEQMARLLQTLSKLLEQAGRFDLVESTIKELAGSQNRVQLASILAAHLDDQSTASSYSVVPAVEIGSALSHIAATSFMTNKATDEVVNSLLSSDRWVKRLFQYSLNNFVPRSILLLAQSSIGRASCEDWRCTIAPALLLKLKSHPDRALDTILGWIESLPDDVLDAPNEEWSVLLYKHAISSRDVNRSLARSILFSWAGKNESSRRSIVACLAGTKPLPTQALARVSLYEALESIASRIQFDGPIGTADAESVPIALEGLLSLMAKEALSKGGDQQHRKSGHRALVEWIVLAKLCGEESQYRKALEYAAAPVLTRKSTGPDVMGQSSVLALLIERIHPDILEGIASDLWAVSGDSKEWSAGLESLTAVAASKKAAQVDGLVAVYLGLLYAAHSKKCIPDFVLAALDGGGSKNLGASFLYSQSMIEAVATNSLVGLVLPRCMAIYTQLTGSTEGDEGMTSDSRTSALFPARAVSAACQVLAACCLYPTGISSSGSLVRMDTDQYASNALVACLETVLAYSPLATDGLVQALFRRVNQVTLHVEELVESLNSTREAREADKDGLPMYKGHGSVNLAHPGYDTYTVRRIARVLMKYSCNAPAATPSTLARLLVLMHAGSTLRSEGHQRAALILNTMNSLKGMVPLEQTDRAGEVCFRAYLAAEIAQLCSGQSSSDKDSDQSNGASMISNSLHEAGMSLLLSLGGVACNFSRSANDASEDDWTAKPYVFASKLCVDDLAQSFSNKLKSTLDRIESLSELDVLIALATPGKLFEAVDLSRNLETKRSKCLTEEEEWELQMKKELADKKASSTGISQGLSHEQQKLLAAQDAQRLVVACYFREFGRVLRSLRFLCSSDIEVGNECLPVVMDSVLSAGTSSCPAFTLFADLKSQSFLTLLSLSASVYEIEETHAPTIAHALLISFSKKLGSDDPTERALPARDSISKSLEVSALPSPCAPAAGVIYEMDQVNDCLSACSFVFLFPVLHAALLGPRTTPGCEAALRVLARHTEMLSGAQSDGRVQQLRREMATSILQLLRHDRAQAFHDPTPVEALVLCYRTDTDKPSHSGAVLTTGELAPLLDDRGALGNKSCRSASMTVILSLAERHRQFMKANPLVENRVWFNCFEKDEEVRLAARQAWTALHDSTGKELGDDSQLPSPSLLYSAPLLPLLSHADESIASAAATAYAAALGKHPNSVARNIEALCKCYIESFPSSMDETGAKAGTSLPKTGAVPAISTKKIPAVAPKKKVAAVKSPLALAGIGKPKVTKRKPSTPSALLKPKEERTLDQATLESQFKLAEPKIKEIEKDSQSKVQIRLGVLRTLASTTTSAVMVVIDESTLILVTSFLMAYGIAESNKVLKASARNALRDIVALYGGTEKGIAFLLSHLESILSSGVADETSLGPLSADKVPRSVPASDRRKEGAVVALGSIALHLHGGDADLKIDATIDMLISALRTPSEDVQLSVADAMTKLMKKGRTQNRVEAILNSLLKDCLQSESLAIQRGAAYGISAVVKGSGIATLKKFEIVTRLEEACSTGSPTAKEGSLFAIELLCDRLGLLFEPYVIALLPTLLKAFSDSSDHVRKAAASTVGMIMSKLSAHGVKLVMPAVLTAFNDPAWRTKQASIHMLGAMSHLAPKQLASALPKVVPKLTEAFADTHPKVKASAHEALMEISTVIRNPEVSSISTVLLKALTDPADYTVKALESLIETEFLHAIDAPSLALIVPILHRGLRERGATTKRFSGLIAGNITSESAGNGLCAIEFDVLYLNWDVSVV
jgi:hypothetical protein